MKQTLASIAGLLLLLNVASAKSWEPPTRDCSLTLPDVGWTFEPGGQVDHGEVLIACMNQEQTKSVNLLRFQVPPALSVHDPKFIEGTRDGFQKAGGHLLAEGHTNINGVLAYWIGGEGEISGNKFQTIRYALAKDGRLYLLIAENLEDAPTRDLEMVSIISSFHILGGSLLPPNKTINSKPLSYRIGQATGCLLMIAIALAVISKRRKVKQEKAGQGT